MRMGENQRLDLQVQIATLYYKQNMSQQEIADMLNLSRPTISRILKDCIDDGIVTIHIKNVSSRQYEMAKTVKKKYDLKNVVVVSTCDDKEQLLSSLGKAAAEYLESIIDCDMRIGVSAGTALAHIIPYLHAIYSYEIDVYQLMGDANHQIDTSSSFLTTEIAKAWHATPHAMHVPLLVNTKVLRDLLIEEPYNKRHFEQLSNLDLAVVGIGNVNSLMPSTSDYWLTMAQDKEILKANDIVGDLSGNFIDKDGVFRSMDVADRTIAVDPKLLKTCKNCVGVACGKEKTLVAKAVLNKNWISSLVIDESLASSLLVD